MKVIITGATGMVGEGVLLECLNSNTVSQVLSISRKSIQKQHPKLKELIVSDFTQLNEHTSIIKDYDACFFCAGISSVGMNEEKYHYITHTTTLAFADALLKVNPEMAFCYISGRGTDSTEKGNTMWARVKGKTENDLNKLGFKQQYNLRPAAMLGFPEQKNVKKLYVIIGKLIYFFAPKSVITLQNLAKAMINAVVTKYPKNILEVKDINDLAQKIPN